MRILCSLMLLFSGLPLCLDASSLIPFSRAEKGTVLVFVSARCPCSKSHEVELKAVAKEYSSKGFQFFAIHSNLEENTPADRDRLKSLDLGFPLIEDDKQEIANEYGAFKTPHVFVLSPEGKVVYMGAVSDCANFAEAKKRYLRTALQQIFSSEKIDPVKTLAVGCPIRR